MIKSADSDTQLSFTWFRLRNMRPIYFIFLSVLLNSLSACKKDITSEGTRSFYMGVTPWPADFTAAEVNNAYQFIHNHCDIVSHHFDDGIPYQEAFLNKPMPLSLQEEINFRKNNTAPGKKILLSIAPLNLSRNEKAAYYKEPSPDITDSIKNIWKQRSFDDPAMAEAYINYCSYLIDQFKPDYINYGVESNADHWDPVNFNAYKEFLSQVYSRLKVKYPSIPLFISFMVSENPAGFSFAAQLVPFTDFIGLSAYPYTSVSSSADGNTDPEKFPADYFTRYIDLDANKPFVFAETAYISEDLLVPAFNLNKKGNSNWQQAYLEKVCTLANERKAKFIIWFCQKDYDAGNLTLKSLNLYQDIFAFWEDTGLIDESGNGRPALQSWKNWQAKIKTD